MFNSRSLTDLIPKVQGLATSFVAAAELAIPGLKVIVCSTYRDNEAQDELYSVGRRGKAGERPVTNARGGESYHNYRVAFDVFPTLYGKPIFGLTDGDQVSDPIWQHLGEIGEGLGLEWGGRWKSFCEGPHFQYTGGLSLEDLKNGQLPE